MSDDRAAIQIVDFDRIRARQAMSLILRALLQKGYDRVLTGVGLVHSTGVWTVRITLSSDSAPVREVIESAADGVPVTVITGPSFAAPEGEVT